MEEARLERIGTGRAPVTDGWFVLNAHDATALVARDPELTGHPELSAAVAERLDAEQAAFLERG